MKYPTMLYHRFISEALYDSFMNIDKAEQLCKEIQNQKISNLHKPVLLADMLYLRYRIHLRKGEYLQAKQAVEQAYATLEDSSEYLRLYHTLLAYSNIHLILGEVDASLGSVIRAKELAPDLNDDKALVKAEFMLGRIAMTKQDYQKARRHFQSALEKVQHYGDAKEQGDILLNIGACYLHEGNVQQSLINTVDAIACKERYRIDLKEYQNASSQDLPVGWVVFAAGEYIRVPVPDNDILSDAYHNVGLAYMNLGDTVQATQFLVQALSLKESMQDTIGIATCASSLGVLHYYKNEGTKALKYMEQSRELFRQHSHIAHVGNVLQNIALIKEKNGDIDSAIQLTEEARQIFASLNERYGELSAAISHAYLLYKRKDYTASEATLKKALKLSEQLQLIVMQAQCYHYLGLCYSQVQQYEEAHRMLEKALELTRQHHNTTELMNVHEALCNVYERQRKFPQAYEHQIEYERLKSQNFDEENDRREKNLLVLHEVERHRRETQANARALQRAEEELEAKTQELGNFAERISQKKDFLALIEQGLEAIQQSSSDEQYQLMQLLHQRVRSESAKTKEEWLTFHSKFNAMQNGFSLAIKQQYPQLTPAEINVSSLLRLNLRSKEIASILHISPKAVENHRMSLRKKMNIGREGNLVHALLRVTLQL